MPNKFDFAFVLDKNIGLKYFPVSQALVTFTVTGEEDPVTLQQMRDAVHGKFTVTQKKVNDFIQSRNGIIAKLGFNERRQKKDVQLIDSGNVTIQKFLADFKKAADGELAAFQREQAAKAQKIASSPSGAATTVKWIISLGWTMYQGSKAVADMWGAEGPLKIYDGIKGCAQRSDRPARKSAGPLRQRKDRQRQGPRRVEGAVRQKGIYRGRCESAGRSGRFV